jgi:hypothetical protein
MKRPALASFWRITILIVGLFIVVIIIFEFIASMQPTRQLLECYTEEVKTMSLQEVADLFHEPLVELIWLPDFVEVTPQVVTQAGYESCWLDIYYWDESVVPPLSYVSIHFYNYGGFQPTKTPPSCSLLFTPSATLGTECRLEVDGSVDGIDLTLTVSLKLNSQFSREDAIQILESVKVINPSELKPNAQTN